MWWERYTNVHQRSQNFSQQPLCIIILFPTIRVVLHRYDFVSLFARSIQLEYTITENIFFICFTWIMDKICGENSNSIYYTLFTESISLSSAGITCAMHHQNQSKPKLFTFTVVFKVQHLFICIITRTSISWQDIRELAAISSQISRLM